MRHGRKPIQDEFTHRTDLTAGQKWQLRHGRKGFEAGAGGARGERVDLGLALVSLVAEPGVPLTLKDIAAWCDCSWQAIYQIEQKALRRMRCRLGAEYSDVIELFNERQSARAGSFS